MWNVNMKTALVYVIEKHMKYTICYHAIVSMEETLDTAHKVIKYEILNRGFIFYLYQNITHVGRIRGFNFYTALIEMLGNVQFIVIGRYFMTFFLLQMFIFMLQIKVKEVTMYASLLYRVKHFPKTPKHPCFFCDYGSYQIQPLA